MTPPIGRLTCAFLLTIPLLTAMPAPAMAAGPGELTAVDIHPAGWERSSSTGVNDRGQVILYGLSGLESEDHPPLSGYVWRAGNYTRLSALPGGVGSFPADINERGEVVGYCLSVEYWPRPCLWQQGRPVDLGTLDERGTGSAQAVNDKSEVVGDVQTLIGFGETRAFIWRRGVMTDLGGAGERSATQINNRSQVAGAYYVENDQRGFLWDRGVLTDLGTLGGTHSLVTDLNDRGQIVGNSTTTDGETHAFRWQNGRMTDLGTLPGGDFSVAGAVNERGEIVGTATDANGESRAVRWDRDGITDLGARNAADINERGWIAGITTDRQNAYLLRNGRMSTGGPAGSVSALNDRGLLAGLTDVGIYTHATIWKQAEVGSTTAPAIGR